MLRLHISKERSDAGEHQVELGSNSNKQQLHQGYHVLYKVLLCGKIPLLYKDCPLRQASLSSLITLWTFSPKLERSGDDS